MEPQTKIPIEKITEKDKQEDAGVSTSSLSKDDTKMVNKDLIPVSPLPTGKKNTTVILIVVGIFVIAAVVGVLARRTYCNEIITKDVLETYWDKEPYVVYETRRDTYELAETDCDERPNCDCISKALWVFNCIRCSCTRTEQVPVTYYRDVQKTRIVPQQVKRC